MSLPVSQYEALLAEVRGLRRKAQHVQQLVNPFISAQQNSSLKDEASLAGQLVAAPKMDPFDPKHPAKNKYEGDMNEDEDCGGSSTQMSVSSEPIANISNPANNLYHGTWPVEKTGLWNSEPNNLGPKNNHNNHIEVTSVMSFASSSGGVPLDRVLGSPSRSRRTSQQQLEAKVDMVYSLLAMLGNQEHADMGETLLALSTNPESCLAMRQSGCIPLLVQLVQSDKDMDTRRKASQALHNLVYLQPDEKIRKREVRLLKLLDQTRAYVDALKNNTEFVSEGSTTEDEGDKHPVQTIAHLMKLSFDEGHRHAICQLGGIYVIANLVETEHSLHGSVHNETHCTLLRRYACMALTNLTFGDSGNKALLCSFRDFMRALVVQLQSPCDELRQVTASVLRNLSWRADQSSREVLREAGAVSGLTKAAMASCKESTLKSILSALWNLSAHCKENKAEICAVEGALGFLVRLLSYDPPSKSLEVAENSGGILRNVSSQIAVREDYREVLRAHNCLPILLEQLKSPSLTIVSNACGTLWNLSAKNSLDQEALWKLGAPGMLRSLNHSKHKMIAMGSSAALKNLLSSRPTHSLFPPLDSTAKAMDLPTLPTLGARKQKALLQDLDPSLAETFENIDRESPTRDKHADKDFLIYEAQPDLSEPFPNNNYAYEEADLSEQPVDYSAKYAEPGKNCATNTKPAQTSFGIYAETDLDQPTDYSLRYAENDSDSEDGSVKAYRATPFEFSLRGKDEQQIDNDRVAGKGEKKPEDSSASDEKEHCSMEDVSEIESRPKAAAEKQFKSQFSSGLMSPEKPVNYCDEGTPGYFSRVSSFGSLNSIPVNEAVSAKDEKIDEESPSKPEASPPNADAAKAVKFDESVNYAEETPLMFSRSSSLASLDSVEQHSIHDDRSSIVSDFSRLTSGIVSPSELPDSPTQTVPPSPKPRKGIATTEYSKASPAMFPRTAGDGRPQPAPRSIQKTSIFEDNVTKFKEESTPVQFSTTTSLSSLTIDDREEASANIVAPTAPLVDRVSPMASGASGTTAEENGYAKGEDAKKDSSASQLSDEEEEENILADCISIGMQNNRHRQSSATAMHPLTKLPTRTAIPLPASKPKPDIQADTTCTYCTEDTPAMLSHAGSNSELSILSIPNEPKNLDLSDDSSNDGLLAECIQSAMPKPREKTRAYSGARSRIPTQQKPKAEDVSPQGSLSSLSVESLETELLEQCISSGMPKQKSSGPKNARAAPAAPTSPPLGGAGVACADELGSDDSARPPTKSGFNADEILDVDLLRTPSKQVDDRMLDPDAMIESLDRFTAALVSQASHLENLAPVTDDSCTCTTWNESTCSNDLLFPNISTSPPNIITFESELESFAEDLIDGAKEVPTTLTESTLIALEAARIAARMKQEAELAHSLTSINSLELDASVSTKRTAKKLSYPASFMLKKAFTHRTESPENSISQISFLENVNPPSAMSEILPPEMQGSLNSVASLPNEHADVRPNFMLKSSVTDTNNTFNMNFDAFGCSISDLEQINPPSLLNDFSDLCTDADEVFEDCRSQFTQEELSRTEDDVTTEYSEAISNPSSNSADSAAVKRVKTLQKRLTPKQKRHLAKERYKTYTIAAEMTMNEELGQSQGQGQGQGQSQDQDQNQDQDQEEELEASVEPPSARLTPKQRRQQNPSRFETQVLDESTLETTFIVSDSSANSSSFNSPAKTLANHSVNSSKIPAASSSKIPTNYSSKIPTNSACNKAANNPAPDAAVAKNTCAKTRPKSPGIGALTRAKSPANGRKSPARNADDIRRTFMQKRLQNLDRLESGEASSSFSDANELLRTLQEAGPASDELLECETLSLVSVDDDSDHNSVGSVDYRTYHKRWGFSGGHVPVIQNVPPEQPVVTKAKIVKPAKESHVKPEPEPEPEREPEPEPEKGIRGRRKLLYSKARPVTKPVMSSNLVKNVTSALKSHNFAGKPAVLSKPPQEQQRRTLKPPMATSSRTSPAHSNKSSANSSPKRHQQQLLKRQGTFTKEETAPSTVRSKIPTTSASANPKLRSLSSSASNRPKTTSGSGSGSGIPSSRTQYSPSRAYNRSSSTDSNLRRTSAKSLAPPNGKKAEPRKSASSSNVNGSASVQTPQGAKQVTSKIASLWKKIEASKSKQQVQKPDTRVWIQPDIVRDTQQPRLMRSNTFENKERPEEQQYARMLTYDAGGDESF